MRNVEIRTVLDSLSGICGVHDGPGQWVDKGHHQIDQRPADNDVVIGHNAEGGEHRRCSDTRESWVNTSEHSNITTLEFLAETELHEGHWNTNGEEANPVGNEEQGSSPLEAKVREAPEVSEADTVADHSQNKSGSAQPASPLGVFSFIREEP